MAPFFLWKRGNGQFYMTVLLPDGKKQYRSLGTKDKATAQETAQRLIGVIPQAPPVTPQLSSFLKDIETYLSGVEPSTLRSYLLAINDFLKIVGNKTLPSYTPLDVERFKQVRSQQVSKTTVNIQMRGIKSIFNRAKKMKLMSSSPFEGVALYRIPKQPPTYLTVEQFKTFLQSVEHPVIRTAFVFGFQTGCRLSEIATLKFEQVDFGRRVVSITQTKTGAMRVLPISQTLFDCLQQLPRRSEWVFSKPSGYPYSPWYLSRTFKRLVVKLGLNPALHFHSLRHSFASNLAMRNVTIQKISSLLGHASISTSMIYAHLQVSELHQEVDLLRM